MPRQPFDVLAVLANLFAQRHDARQQWLRRALQFRTQSFGFFGIHVAHICSRAVVIRNHNLGRHERNEDGSGESIFTSKIPAHDTALSPLGDP